MGGLYAPHAEFCHLVLAATSRGYFSRTRRVSCWGGVSRRTANAARTGASHCPTPCIDSGVFGDTILTA